MSNATTAERIELPREEGESARAYAARVEYILAGPDRSLDKTRQKLGKDSPGYTRTLAEWSSQYGWAEHARRYDDLLISMRTQEAAAAYHKSLDDYRDRYGRLGKAIFETSVRLLTRLNAVAATVDVGPGTLAIITNAARVAADLEALALQIEPLLEQADGIDRH